MDGSVKISFANTRVERPLSINEGRNSFIGNQRRNSLDSTTTEGFQRRDKELETFLVDSSANVKLKGISTDSQVCFAFYSAKQSAAPSQTSHNNEEEGDTSPTASDLNAPMPKPIFRHCNAITFAEPKKMSFHDLDWSSLEKNFYSEENRQ